MTRLSEAYDRGGRWRTVVRAGLLFVGSLIAAVGFVATAASLIAGLGFEKAGALRIATLLGGTLLLAALLARPIRTSGGQRSLALAGVGIAAGVAGLGLFWTTLPAAWTGDLAGLPPVALGTYAVGLVAAFGARLAASGGSGRARSEVPDAVASDSAALDSTAPDSATPDSTDPNLADSTRDDDGLGGVEAVVGGRTSTEESDRSDGVGADPSDSPAASVRDAPPGSSEVASDSSTPSATAAVGDGGETDDDLEFFDDES